MTENQFYFITDLNPAVTKEDIGDTSASILISTVKQFADLLSDGKFLNVAMLIVDNGHTFTANSDESTVKVLKFIQANSLMQENEHEHQADVALQRLSRSSKARLIVFTANFLNDSQTNSQLAEVDHEFKKLKEHFLGNKVHILVLSFYLLA